MASSAARRGHGLELPAHLQAVLRRLLGPGDDLGEWLLLEVLAAGRDCVGLSELLSLTKCPALSSFAILDFERLRPAPPLDAGVVADIPPADDWVEIQRNPGQYSRQLISADGASPSEQYWLFGAPEKGSAARVAEAPLLAGSALGRTIGPPDVGPAEAVASTN